MHITELNLCRFDFDFYLQAHAGIQGHVKATHYTVVYDENSLTADEVQQGTHDVSYLYARATKAVSLVPAAYYADLACERGRCYLNDFLVDDKSTVTGGKGLVDKEEEKNRVFEAASAHWGQGVSHLSFFFSQVDTGFDLGFFFPFSSIKILEEPCFIYDRLFEIAVVLELLDLLLLCYICVSIFFGILCNNNTSMNAIFQFVS